MVGERERQAWEGMGRGPGLLLKLGLKSDSLEKTLGKIEGKRRRGRQRMRWLDGITDSMDMGLGKTPGVGDGQGGLVCCMQSLGSQSRT